MFIDSHCHLNDPELTASFDELAKQIENSDVDLCVDIGFTLENSLVAVKHAEEKPWIYATVGIHPTECYSANPDDIVFIESLAKKDKVVAIGEIGLDYHYDDTDREKQEYWFRAQIRLAKKLGMPIVIHDREAHDDCLRIMKEEGVLAAGKEPAVPVLWHCYSGSAEMATQLAKLGVYMSVAGPVTYKSSKKAPAVVAAIPMDRILVETDCPFLTPEPKRGEFPNTPLNVGITCAKVAELKGVSTEEMARITAENTKRFYRIR